jgi:hypothetical protein
MPNTCSYIPQIKAEFGRTVTDHEIDAEFQAIERAFQCFEEQIGTILLSREKVYNHGIIDNSYTINPAFGIIHYLEIQGDTELQVDIPAPGTPRLITLVIANAGSVENGDYGRFNFKTGATWSADRDHPMDGKPWNMYPNLTGAATGMPYVGFYGGVVQCVYDGIGWVHMVYARHHLAIDGNLNPDDIYDWR